MVCGSVLEITCSDAVVKLRPGGEVCGSAAARRLGGLAKIQLHHGVLLLRKQS